MISHLLVLTQYTSGLIENNSDFLVSQFDNVSSGNYTIKYASRLLGLTFKCQALLCWNNFSAVCSWFTLAKLQRLQISRMSCDLHGRVSWKTYTANLLARQKKKSLFEMINNVQKHLTCSCCFSVFISLCICFQISSYCQSWCSALCWFCQNHFSFLKNFSFRDFLEQITG